MQAVLLAGGLGTRLAPYTTILPKPLMPVGEMPILEIIIRQLRKAGFDKIEIATGYLSGLIEAYFSDGARWDVQIRYHREPERLGTAGPIAFLEEFLEPAFLFMNGDVLTDLDFGELYRAHLESGALLSTATCTRTFTLSLGSIVRGAAGDITDYIEKPTYTFECSAGVYAASRDVVAYIERSRPYDMPELVRRLIHERAPVRPHPITGFWLDIGTPDDYRLAVEKYADTFAALLL
jgi:NDP-sugar pyrophosphorylase family protein